MAHGDDVSDSGSGESWGQMSCQVVVSLLESVVLGNEMQIVSSNDHGSCHLVVQHDTLEDSASDRHVGGEWALVVDVLSLNGGDWGLEACKQSIPNSGYLPRPIFL